MKPASPPASDRQATVLALPAVFLAWGFLTVLNDALIPQLKALFGLGWFGVMLVPLAFFGAYFTTALPWGSHLARRGYRATLAAGLALMAAGALLIAGAAATRLWPGFLGAFFVLASGITALQVSCNPWVGVLGEPAGAASRLSWAQAWNAAGTMLAPLFGGGLLLAGAAATPLLPAALPPVARAAWEGAALTRITLAYGGIALVVCCGALALRRLRLPEPPWRAAAAPGLRAALALPGTRHAVLAVAAYFGAEVALGSFMINYLMLPGIAALPAARAALFVALYWGGSMLGRLASTALLARVPARAALGGAAALATVLVLTTVLGHGHLAGAAVVAVGLCNSLQYPTLFALALERAGPLAARVSSLLVMGVVGGALVPPLQGLLADRVGLQASYVVPLACYLVVLGYALRRPRVRAPA